jgi:DNA-binding transcriptional regulator WhiA
MKKIFLLVAFLATSMVQYSFAQDHSGHAQSTDLLGLYYNIKDALISGNAATTTAQAVTFVKAINAEDAKKVPETSRLALSKGASNIAQAKEIKKQREYFAAFSEDMYALAKSTKLSTAPIYKAYCPMKKANWLSSEAAIKNPYYGTAMLSCGKITETLK